MENAAFKLDTFRFPKANIDFSKAKKKNEIDVEFIPAGKFKESNSLFELTLGIKINFNQSDTPAIEITCIAEYSFREKISFNDIPQYFYSNSIAILFPYIRAFISNLSLQANYPALILPTLNMTKLGIELKEKSFVH